MLLLFFTKLREGNVFIGVCITTGRGGYSPPMVSILLGLGIHPPPRYMGYGRQAGGTHLTGMLSLFFFTFNVFTGVCLFTGGRR